MIYYKDLNLSDEEVKRRAILAVKASKTVKNSSKKIIFNSKNLIVKKEIAVLCDGSFDCNYNVEYLSKEKSSYLSSIDLKKDYNNIKLSGNYKDYSYKAAHNMSLSQRQIFSCSYNEILFEPFNKIGREYLNLKGFKQLDKEKDAKIINSLFNATHLCSYEYFKFAFENAAATKNWHLISPYSIHKDGNAKDIEIKDIDVHMNNCNIYFYIQYKVSLKDNEPFAISDESGLFSEKKLSNLERTNTYKVKKYFKNIVENIEYDGIASILCLAIVILGIVMFSVSILYQNVIAAYDAELNEMPIWLYNIEKFPVTLCNFIPVIILPLFILFTDSDGLRGLYYFLAILSIIYFALQGFAYFFTIL